MKIREIIKKKRHLLAVGPMDPNDTTDEDECYFFQNHSIEMIAIKGSQS